MNVTSGEYDASVNEFELAKVTPEPSKIVRPPRVADSPVSFECKLHQILDFSSAPTSSSLVIGQIVSIHIERRVSQRGTAGSEFVGSHRTHGWDPVHKNDAAI
jgi:flavin reductase (DIM6/NTAB) family NADH-FMN oxidoreductase RutF